MKKITLIDTTMSRAYELHKGRLGFKTKLEAAGCIDRLGVDFIELEPITGTRAEALFNKTAATTLKAVVSACVLISADNVRETWESVCHAEKSRLNLLVPSSPVQMEYSGHVKAPAMLEKISQKGAECVSFCRHTEVTFVDATRAEPEFLREGIRRAVAAGVKAVTLCDTAGIFLPGEFS
ncbi:MAG: hypothetical protein K6C36_08070, partial [Clostridia bacterium]|nr:hypothetical protein [Clostridia bacterium]